MMKFTPWYSSTILLEYHDYHADSFNLLVNNGAAAGQVIFHVRIPQNYLQDIDLSRSRCI